MCALWATMEPCPLASLRGILPGAAKGEEPGEGPAAAVSASLGVILAIVLRLHTAQKMPRKHGGRDQEPLQDWWALSVPQSPSKSGATPDSPTPRRPAPRVECGVCS